MPTNLLVTVTNFGQVILVVFLTLGGLKKSIRLFNDYREVTIVTTTKFGQLMFLSTCEHYFLIH